jgi:hypothetical protein
VPKPSRVRWSSLVTVVSWSQLPSCFLPLPSEPYPALLPPLLDLSPCRALLHHWPKSCSSTLSTPGRFLVDQQRIHPSALLTRAGDSELLSSGKPDGPVWHFRLSSFPVLKPSGPAGGRHIRTDRLLHSSLCGQNPQ